jgi:hypothetical protein
MDMENGHGKGQGRRHGLGRIKADRRKLNGIFLLLFALIESEYVEAN